ncbi:hypothetical protein NKG05_04685 [Oerskovia sp. M15]
MRTSRGRHVNGPLTAYAQAEVINKHALAISEGQTYAELPQDDERRATVMNASFLRASLFTSVVAFGIAALVIGLGILFILIGIALRRIASGPPSRSRRPTRTPRAADSRRRRPRPGRRHMPHRWHPRRQPHHAHRTAGRDLRPGRPPGRPRSRAQSPGVPTTEAPPVVEPRARAPRRPRRGRSRSPRARASPRPMRRRSWNPRVGRPAVGS